MSKDNKKDVDKILSDVLERMESRIESMSKTHEVQHYSLCAIHSLLTLLKHTIEEECKDTKYLALASIDTTIHFLENKFKTFSWFNEEQTHKKVKSKKDKH